MRGTRHGCVLHSRPGHHRHAPPHWWAPAIALPLASGYAWRAAKVLGAGGPAALLVVARLARLTMIGSSGAVCPACGCHQPPCLPTLIATGHRAGVIGSAEPSTSDQGPDATFTGGLQSTAKVNTIVALAVVRWSNPVPAFALPPAAMMRRLLLSAFSLKHLKLASCLRV